MVLGLLTVKSLQNDLVSPLLFDANRQNVLPTSPFLLVVRLPELPGLVVNVLNRFIFSILEASHCHLSYPSS